MEAKKTPLGWFARRQAKPRIRIGRDYSITVDKEQLMKSDKVQKEIKKMKENKKLFLQGQT